MAELLTPRQAEVLAALEKWAYRHGQMPSQRELAQALRIAHVRAIQKHLEALAEKGYLRLHPGRDYGIELLHGLKVPVVYSVAAGTPIEAHENVEDWVDVPAGVFRRKPDVFMKVKGHSMEGPPTHICDGDMIGVFSASTADPRQVVVVAIPSKKTDREELTVKELRIDNGDLLLIPHNPLEQTMRYPPEDVRIVGIYSGILMRQAAR